MRGNRGAQTRGWEQGNILHRTALLHCPVGGPGVGGAAGAQREPGARLFRARLKRAEAALLQNRRAAPNVAFKPAFPPEARSRQEPCRYNEARSRYLPP